MSSRRQLVKWTVYGLLFFDFVLYFVQDASFAQYVLGAQSTAVDYARAYVTSIDLLAWFVLILLFEIETYVLADRSWTGSTKWAVHGIRMVCYAAIAHTTFADWTALREFRNPLPLSAAADVCAYADGDRSFLRNRDYEEIEPGNCAGLGHGPQFFGIGGEAVITDRAGLHEGLILAWTDLVESVAWILVILASEFAVRIQPAAVGGAAATLLESLKAALYVVILCIALYWGSKGQFLYLWDELLWICGFMAIDGNIREWRRPVWRTA